MSVFTKVSHAQLKRFLTQYPVGPLINFQGIGEGVENTNYFVDTADGRWVLTLFERLNYDDLPYFLGLMEHLATRGFPGAMPMRNQSGDTLTSLNAKPAALVRRLAGQSVLFPTLHQCEEIGRALGDLHVLGQSYGGHCDNSRGPAWRQHTAEAILPKADEDAAELIRDELQAQATLDLAALPQGVIHADLFRDNALFVDERLTGVIDFYYACNDALLYDLAITVNDWCFETDGSLNGARWAAMTHAYRSRRELTPDEISAWPLVLRAAALRFYLSRLYDWLFPREGDVVHVKDPAAYRRVLERHRRHAPPAL
ncbi:MAG: homoserine kinase [Polycyclovorans sp.]|jgi:homoserine kinase type II|nr:homoserine kinase [Polycyclovorans sp.]MEC8848150.1 homoserine kinase [Pseudomonadota bacterium]|tara:strand:+ start:10700 stop:11638 length:939 start_codon:yes stop_codon:yes gene_type:complete